MSGPAQKPHPNLDMVAQTIAADLKCKIDVALKQAILGIAATAKQVGLKVSKNPTPDEIEAILQEHGPKIEMAIKQRAAQMKKKPNPSTGGSRH